MKIYYRSKCYDPVSARFIQKDPIGLEAGDTNLYRYVGNNPGKYSDPTGTELTFCAAVGVGATIGGIAGGLGEMIANKNWTWQSAGEAAISGGVGGAMTVVGAGSAIVGAGVTLASAAGSVLFGLSTGAAVNLIMDPSIIPTPIRPHLPKDNEKLKPQIPKAPVQYGGEK